jgi:class 3 adenylate cyclase
MDLGSWLRSLGLERYEAAFGENEIDERVLPNLTQEDLKEIGVGPVGHRRILLEAIAALRADTGVKPPSADAATTSSAPSVAPEDRAERRQVTVMFSDLVGSTALSARMDPKDLREVISAYQKCVAETVGRFGGFVAKYMGDGVLVYFGYPQAHEDDAERAVRAGLELVAVKSPQPDAAKAQSYFERALDVAHQQQTKSWELRAAMSLARLWRDQGKPQQARELLTPVYGWFTEGFDTLDLKEAKALLEELAA